MPKDNSFELFKNIRVTEASDIEYNQGKRLDTSKYKQLDRSLNGATIPTQSFVDRLSKHYAYNVCKSNVDLEKKEVQYDVMVKADKSERKTVPFADAAKCFGWSGFTFSDDLQTVIPKK